MKNEARIVDVIKYTDEHFSPLWAMYFFFVRTNRNKQIISVVVMER